jgi:Flp pilus assembly protein TadG
MQLLVVTMSIRSIFRRTRNGLAGFFPANRGNVAITFAIVAVPIIGFVGAAVDYSRGNAARSAMQVALDSTALMLSRDVSAGILTADKVETQAKTYFDALYKMSNPNSIEIKAVYTAADSTMGSTIQVSGSGSLPTQFMKVAGFPTIGFSSSSTSAWGTSRMRVAMVLDVTGSMDDNDKMSNMKTAATNMIATLSKLNKNDGDVYISVIPFAKDVNAGGGITTRDWVNWTEWEAEPPMLDTAGGGAKPKTWADIGPGSTCPFTTDTYGFACTNQPATKSTAATTATIPSSGTYAGYICPSLDNGSKVAAKGSVYYNGCYTSVVNTTTVVDSGSGAKCGKGYCSCTGSGKDTKCTRTTFNHVWRAAGTAAAPSHDTWNGCVNDRDQDYDISNAPPQLGVATTLFYAEQWSACPAPVTPMDNQWTTLTNNINKMVPNGNTNQAIGLAWGWLSLTAGAPLFTPAKDSKYTYDDYIVLVSDGLNTQDRWYSNASQIDARQKLLCTKLKANPYNFKIFTVQINTSTKNPDPESAVLKSCASGNDNFQMITSADKTADAFANITSQLSQLRIAR